MAVLNRQALNHCPLVEYASSSTRVHSLLQLPAQRDGVAWTFVMLFAANTNFSLAPSYLSTPQRFSLETHATVSVAATLR